MIWLLLAWTAQAGTVSVAQDALGTHLLTVNEAVSGKLVVGGNWDTFKAVKKAVAAGGVEIRTEHVGDTDGLARTDLEKILDKDDLKCGLAVRRESDTAFNLLEVGDCKAPRPTEPAKAAAPPAPAEAPATPAPAEAPAPPQPAEAPASPAPPAPAPAPAP